MKALLILISLLALSGCYPRSQSGDTISDLNKEVGGYSAGCYSIEFRTMTWKVKFPINTRIDSSGQSISIVSGNNKTEPSIYEYMSCQDCVVMVIDCKYTD